MPRSSATEKLAPSSPAMLARSSRMPRRGAQTKSKNRQTTTSSLATSKLLDIWPVSSCACRDVDQEIIDASEDACCEAGLWLSVQVSASGCSHQGTRVDAYFSRQKQ